MQRKVLLNGRIVVNGGYEVDFHYISKRKERKSWRKSLKEVGRSGLSYSEEFPLEENWKKNAKNWQPQKNTSTYRSDSWRLSFQMENVSFNDKGLDTLTKKRTEKNLFFSLFAPNNINISFHCWRTKMFIIKSKIAIRRLPSPKQ